MGGHEAFPNGHEVRVIDTADAAFVLIVNGEGVAELRAQVPRETVAATLRAFLSEFDPVDAPAGPVEVVAAAIRAADGAHELGAAALAEVAVAALLDDRDGMAALCRAHLDLEADR